MDHYKVALTTNLALVLAVLSTSFSKVEGQPNIPLPQANAFRFQDFDSENGLLHKDTVDPIIVKKLSDSFEQLVNKTRKARQDDGDGDDGGDEAAAPAGGGGIGGIFGFGEAPGGAFGTVIAAHTAVLGLLVEAFTQAAQVANHNLNGTDTPDIPSFLAKSSLDAAKLFQMVSGGMRRQGVPPGIPGLGGGGIPGLGGGGISGLGGGGRFPGLGQGGGGIPSFQEPKPPSLSSNYPAQPPNYVDENVKQLIYEGPSSQINDGGSARPAFNNPTKIKVESLNSDVSPDNDKGRKDVLPPKATYNPQLTQHISSGYHHKVSTTDKPESDNVNQAFSQRVQSLLINVPNRPKLSVYKPASFVSGQSVTESDSAHEGPINSKYSIGTQGALNSSQNQDSLSSLLRRIYKVI